jgi:hypothetical protein
MFDSIGKDLDDAALQRSATAAAINTALIGLAVASTVAAGWWTVRAPHPKVLEATQVELAILDQSGNGEEELVAPAPPGAAEGAGAAPEVKAPEAPSAAPPPDEADPEPTALPAEVPASAVAASAPVAMAPQRGVADGITGLLGRATSSRAVTAPLEAPPGDGAGSSHGVATTESKPDMRWRRTNEPDWPAFAKGYAVGAEERCFAHVVLDPIGEPITVEVAGCPRLFAEETRRSLQTWRAWPPEGAAIQRATDVVVRFRQL